MRMIATVVLVASLAGVSMSPARASSRSLSVTRAAVCAPVAHQPTHNPWTATQRTLAPLGPTSIRVCSYIAQRFDGVERISRQRVVVGTRAVTLVKVLDALRAPRPPKHKLYNAGCSGGDNPDIMHLAYRDGRTAVVYLRTPNCFFATNGDLILHSQGPTVLQALDFVAKLLG